MGRRGDGAKRRQFRVNAGEFGQEGEDPKGWGLSITPDDLYRLATMLRTEGEQALRLIEERGLTRPRDLEAHGITRAQPARLVKEGLFLRQARGVSVSGRHALTAEHTLAQVAKRVPNGVFWLLTVLRFHGLTTQSHAEVWIAFPEKGRRPRLAHPRLRVARFSGAALNEGIEEHCVGVGSGPRLFGRQEGRRLLQIPEQDRHRCRGRGPAGFQPEASPPMKDGSRAL